MQPAEVTTERLILRRWKDADRKPFVAMNADPVVAEFLAGVLTPDESNAMIDRHEANFERLGFGWFAVERRDNGEFIGATGCNKVNFNLDLLPSIEIGWRFAPAVWGKGFATEAARAALDWGFDCGITDVVAFTAMANHRSERVMQRIGMTRDEAADFDHPKLEPGHPRRRHIVYRATPETIDF